MSERDTVCQISSGGSEFWVLISGPGMYHSLVQALGGRSLTVLEFASGRVDRGGIKIDPPEPVCE